MEKIDIKCLPDTVCSFYGNVRSLFVVGFSFVLQAHAPKVHFFRFRFYALDQLCIDLRQM